MASLLNGEQTTSNSNSKDQEDERRILLEVMQLSKLEDQKNKGNLNLDFLKRKQKRSELTESKDQIKLDPKLVPVDFKKRGGGLQPILMGAYPSAQTF
jgi:hypothetical protein